MLALLRRLMACRGLPPSYQLQRRPGGKGAACAAGCRLPAWHSSAVDRALEIGVGRAPMRYAAGYQPGTRLL